MTLILVNKGQPISAAGTTGALAANSHPIGAQLRPVN
jgi:hypothetical protein